MDKNPIQKEERRRKDFSQLDRISSLFDDKFNFMGFRFGLDPLLNLIPYGGQFIAFGTSLMLVIVMLRNGASSKVAVKMLLNILFDAIIGSIPLFGYIFDFFHKANKKNVNLLRQHYFDGKHQGNAKGILITVLVILFVVCLGVFFLIWTIGGWAWTFMKDLF